MFTVLPVCAAVHMLVCVCVLCKCVNALAALHYVTLAQLQLPRPLPTLGSLLLLLLRLVSVMPANEVCPLSTYACVCVCVFVEISLSISVAMLLLLLLLGSPSARFPLPCLCQLRIACLYSCLFSSLWLRSNPFDSLANCCATLQLHRYT